MAGEKTPKVSFIHSSMLWRHSIHWSFDVFVARLMVIIGKNIPLYKIWRRCVVPSSPRRMPLIQAHPQSLGSCVCPRCRVPRDEWLIFKLKALLKRDSNHLKWSSKHDSRIHKWYTIWYISSSMLLDFQWFWPHTELHKMIDLSWRPWGTESEQTLKKTKQPTRVNCQAFHKWLRRWSIQK